jgi:hypothetical protein
MEILEMGEGLAAHEPTRLEPEGYRSTKIGAWFPSSFAPRL